MSVLIGSARHDEFGGIGYGAQPGDQTGHECETQEWYLHEYGWVCIRAKSDAAREKIAQDMEYICANPHIGYSQPHDQSLYNASKPYGFNCSLVTTDCETDCAKAVRVCCLFAGIDTPDFYTGTEISVLGSTGEFDILRNAEYTETDRRLKRGDILCTQKQGHTVVVLEDGPDAGGLPSSCLYKATGNVYIRIGPGTEFPYIGVLKKGEILNVSLALTGWAYGTYKDMTGYVSMKYLEQIETERLVATGNVHLRTGAGVLYRSIGVIKRGEVVNATGRTKKVLGTVWHEVEHGSIGWASGKYLEREV